MVSPTLRRRGPLSCFLSFLSYAADALHRAFPPQFIKSLTRLCKASSVLWLKKLMSAEILLIVQISCQIIQKSPSQKAMLGGTNKWAQLPPTRPPPSEFPCHFNRHTHLKIELFQRSVAHIHSMCFGCPVSHQGNFLLLLVSYCIKETKICFDYSVYILLQFISDLGVIWDILEYISKT